VSYDRAGLGTPADPRHRWAGLSAQITIVSHRPRIIRLRPPALYLNAHLALLYCELLLLSYTMNSHFENHAAFTANSAVSSTIYSAAGGRPSGLTAAKRWVSFLPLNLMSPHRKLRNGVFSGVKSMISASLAKLIYALGSDKKRVIQGKHGERAQYNVPARFHMSIIVLTNDIFRYS
jgi:hypothetical protein